MKRSRLKNIINKSKDFSKSIGDSFDLFKKSLPIEIDDNYRLEAAWKAYGSPKDYKTALWEGLIQPINENEFKLPSIGYNEETDEYEYLNQGKDNDIVAKDIRVWDNDVIPFVQELKHGGYVRTFNESKNCWTYSKNSQKENTLDLEQINIQKEPSGELINSFLKGGKSEYKKVKSDKAYYDKDSDTVYYTNDEDLVHEGFHARPNSVLLEQLKPYYENLNDEKILNFGGNLLFVKRFEGDPGHFYSPEELGARISAAKFRTKGNNYTPEFFKYLRTNENLYGDNMRDLLYMYNDENLSKIFNIGNPQSFKQGEKPLYDTWKSQIDFDLSDDYDLEAAYNDNEIPFEQLENWRKSKGQTHLSDKYKKPNHMTYSDPGYGWSGSDKDGWIFRPSPRQMLEHSFEDYIKYWDKNEPNSKLDYAGRVYYKTPVMFKQGGQMSVIPEGALHAHKNHMEGAGEDFTAKGIPVVDNKGDQQAEIERDEIIFRKEVTDKMEELFKKYKEEDSTSKKDEIAIEMGKILTCEITKHTEDRTGLIDKILNQ